MAIYFANKRVHPSPDSTVNFFERQWPARLTLIVGMQQNYIFTIINSDVYNTAKHTHRRQEMRTNVVINDNLMASALKVSGFKTKKDAIEEGLRLLVQMNSHKEIKQFRGKLKWSGNLNEMRMDK